METESDNQQAKPMKVKDKDQALKYANEILTKWKEYSELKKRMECLHSTVKKYMEDNDMSVFTVDSGKFILVKQTRNFLNRALIEDIEQYYEQRDITMMYKNPN